MKVGFGTIIKNALILFAITLVAGLALGFVYQMTKEPIAAQEKAAQDAANKAVFLQAETFGEVDTPEAGQVEALLSDNGIPGVAVQSVRPALDASGNVLGYVIQVRSKGYGDFIVFTVGIANDGTVNGVSIISINETPGLGMNAEKVIVPQFSGKPAATFTVTKQAAASGSEIEAISGATITSRAMVNGVNAAELVFKNILGGGQ